MNVVVCNALLSSFYRLCSQLANVREYGQTEAVAYANGEIGGMLKILGNLNLLDMEQQQMLSRLALYLITHVQADKAFDADIERLLEGCLKGQRELFDLVVFGWKELEANQSQQAIPDAKLNEYL